MLMEDGLSFFKQDDTTPHAWSIFMWSFGLATELQSIKVINCLYYSNKKTTTTTTNRSNGYLCFITITLEVQFTIFLIFFPPFLHIQFSIFQTFLSATKVVTSWLILIQKVENIFKSIFWIINHLIVKLGQLIHIVMSVFVWFMNFVCLEDGFLIQDHFTLPVYCNWSKTNYEEFVVFYSLEGVHWDNQNKETSFTNKLTGHNILPFYYNYKWPWN